VDLMRIERWLEQRFGFVDRGLDDRREEDEREERTYARLRTRDILVYPPIICALGAGLVTVARVLTGADLATAAADTYAIGGVVALVDIAAKLIRRRSARRDLAAHSSTDVSRSVGSRTGEDA
jgi:hypothetical protein